MKRKFLLLYIIPFYFFLFLTDTNAQTNLPDIDVTYISRSPAYNYDAVKKWPSFNETVTFTAHLKNAGSFPTGNFDYVWKVDGQVLKIQTSNSLAPGEKKEYQITWPWQHQIVNDRIQDNHTIEFVADPNNLITEISKTNNSLKDYTQGLALGFWVEQSTYNHFNQNQLGYCQGKTCHGSNSWEDWAQRQVKEWNRLFTISNPPVRDRVRLDKIVIVNDCTLPLAGGISGNHPDLRDKTVDMMWGFTAGGVTNTTACGCQREGGNCLLYSQYPEHQNFEYPLMHELSHARYLIDLWGFNISKNLVEVTENENLIAGTSLLPYTSWDLVYESKEKGMMVGDNYASGYDTHSAMALNRIAGLRARGGNYNAPSVIGEYLNDLPQTVKYRFLSTKGLPIINASIKIFKAKPRQGEWYGKTFSGEPDFSGTTNNQGIFISSSPIFTKPILHTYGRADGIFLYRIQKGTNISYGFQEITDANLAYWTDNKELAVIDVKTKIADNQKDVFDLRYFLTNFLNMYTIFDYNKLVENLGH